jgi:HSP20 family molecular chaperone IbpA
VFHRSFRLPRLVDRNAILANYENGLLRITLPKDSAQTLVNVNEVK